MDEIRYVLARWVLAPLIRRNYRLRRAGKLPDEWYWADILLIKWVGLKGHGELVP